MLEDSAADAEMIQRALKKDNVNFECRVAANKEEYLLALDEFKPGLILSDNTLPLFNGSEALQIIQERFLHIPFILVTGTTSEEFAARIIKAGADDYLLKDRLARLPAAIEAALRQRQFEKEKSEALQKIIDNEQRYRHSLDNLIEGVQIVGFDWRYLYVNNTFVKHSKYARENLLGHTVMEKYPGIEQTAIFKVYQRCFRERVSIHLENELIFPDKTKGWFELSFQPLPEGIFILSIDITERKKAEQAIIDSEEQYRVLVEQATDAIFIADETGRFLTVNSSACKLSQCSTEELLQKTFYDFALPEDVQREPFHFEELRQGKTASTERIMRRKDGSQIYVEISAKMLTDGRLLAFVKDISERKKAAQQLSQEKQLLRTLIDNLPDYIYVKDTGLRHIINNSANIKLLGASTEEETLGKTVFDYFDPGIAKQYFEDDQFVLHSKQPLLDREELIVNNAGESRWLLTNKLPLKDKDNNVIGVVGISRDITHQKNTEDIIRKEKELSDSVINNLPGIFYMFDEAGNFIRWNKNFETITGYNADEIKHLHHFDLYAADDIPKIKLSIQSVSREKIQGIEVSFFTREKKKLPYFINSWSIKLDNNKFLIGIGIDLTERKIAEEALRQSERKYKLLFESNPMPMWMISRTNMKIIDVNDSALKHYGYTRDEFLSLDMKKMRPPEDILKFTKEIESDIPGVSNRGIWRHIKKDGSLIYVEINTYDYLANDGIQKRLLLSNDVTEKIKAEEKLKHSYQEIRELASHLQDVREEERRNMAREIHDELGQQITGLKMDISWLSKKLVTAEDTIKEKINRVLLLLDGTIKTIRKIATDLRPSILDDLGIIEAMEWQSQEFEKRSGIAVQFSSSIPVIEIPGNIAICLFRIYQESLTNVARHASATTITTTFCQQGNQLLLTVTDNGKGFNAKDAHYKKTLGLLGMKERALMIGGQYRITSQPGKGTCVTLQVPVEKKDF